jgi:hypothetical protein
MSHTPGLSGSAVALLDHVAPVLHSHERVPLFRLFYYFIASSSSPPRFVPHGRASEAEAEGIGVGAPKQSPACGALYPYAYTLTLDRHQPMTSARVLGRSWVGG